MENRVMTQEEKELLLKDLCARLPYGVICKCYHTEFDEWDGKPFVAIYNETLSNINVNGVFLAGGFYYEIDEIKPYLRPMSLMTEEELDDYENYTLHWCDKSEYGYASGIVEYLISHHLDYRGLIPMGLALEAPEGMYKTK